MSQQLQQAGVIDQCPKALHTAAQILQVSVDAACARADTAAAGVSPVGGGSSSSAPTSRLFEPLMLTSFEHLAVCITLLMTSPHLAMLQAANSQSHGAILDATAGKCCGVLLLRLYFAPILNDIKLTAARSSQHYQGTSPNALLLYPYSPFPKPDSCVVQAVPILDV